MTRFLAVATGFLLLGVPVSVVRAQGGLGRVKFDTLPGGQIQVANSGPSGWAGLAGWQLVLDRVIQPADGSAGELGSPFALQLLPDGRLIVVDQKPMSIQLFDRAGNIIRTIGRMGRGPGEYQAPQVALFRDSLFIHDHQLIRGTVMSLEGGLARSFPTGCCVRFAQVAVDTAGRIRIMQPATGATRQWLVLSPTGQRLDSFPEPVVQPALTWQLSRARPMVPLSPEDRSYMGRDGLLVYGSTGKYQLMVTRNGKDTVRTFGRTDVTPMRAAIAVRESLLAERVGHDAELRAAASVRDIPSTYPLWRELAADGAGNIWVLAGGEGSRAARLDVFTSTGTFLGSVPSPFTSLAQTSWTATHVAAIATDADDLPLIRIYRIVKTRQ